MSTEVNLVTDVIEYNVLSIMCLRIVLCTSCAYILVVLDVI